MKPEKYQRIFNQIESLLIKCNDPVSQMSTVSAVLYHKMDYFFWCGFYRIVNDQLIVGPYQGTVACQVLEKNKGVCWAGVNLSKTIIVPDVSLFPGHIACDSRSKSEIVVPLRNKLTLVIAVLDVDSTSFNSFDDIDAEYLEKILTLINIE